MPIAIVGRIAVGLASIVLHDDHVLAFADILGALEHHVFEEMCEPGLAFAFVARTRVVRDRNRVRGRGVIFGKNDAEARSSA